MPGAPAPPSSHARRAPRLTAPRVAQGHAWGTISTVTRHQSLRLADRILIANAFVLLAAAALLAATPFSVSFPPKGKELLALAGGVVVMIMLDGLLIRRALRPIDELRALMRRIDPLQPGERLDPEHAGGDLSELAHGFNDMADRLEAERREAARRTLAGREEERRALARELHDEVGQTLTAVLAHLDAVGRRAPAELGDAVRECRDGARSALEQVRSVVNRLRPDTLEDLGLVSALRALSGRIARQTGLDLSLVLDERLPPLDPDAELVVYRIAQEAMTNAVRHAEARALVLTFGMDDQGLLLSVRDDGRGVSDRVLDTSGIRGMRERALLVGGTLQIESLPERGTDVRLRIPTLEAHA
jgi:two-component system sensor histidine kinase UhpB